MSIPYLKKNLKKKSNHQFSLLPNSQPEVAKKHARFFQETFPTRMFFFE
jgi:hypothetical protein